MAVSINIIAFCAVMPCSLVCRSQHVRAEEAAAFALAVSSSVTLLGLRPKQRYSHHLSSRFSTFHKTGKTDALLEQLLSELPHIVTIQLLISAEY
jgi:hypothetical protein